MSASENQIVTYNPNYVVSEDAIRMMIVPVRGVQVMLDRDLAALYGVEVKYLNRQVKRNRERFPPDFMFTLTKEEHNSLIISPRSQSVTSEYKQQNRQTKYMPFIVSIWQ